jgi:tetratricopeptide (TPR) repeat protein
MSITQRGYTAARFACHFFWCVALALGSTAAASAETQPAARFDVNGYAIAAQILPSTHMLKCRTTVQFTPRADLVSAVFELNSSLRVEKATDAGGQSLSFRQDGLNLTVNALNPWTQGKRAAITLDYGGALANADGSPVEGLKLAYVGPEGSYLLYAGRWFPVSGYGVNRFTAAMRITVPSEEVVVASGKQTAPERQPGFVTYTYTYDQPSFPGTVIAGKYVVQPATAAGADITLYLKPGHAQYAASYGDEAGRILAYFSDKFGALPSGHLALAEIADDTVGGYAAPGLVTLASRGFSKPVNRRLLAHEISHQWWRLLVSPATPDDVYLDEGLATYCAAMYIQQEVGEGAFEDAMHDIQVGALTHEDVSAISQAGHLHEFTPEFQSVVFQKGAMVFHMLRWVIGDDAFFQTLRTIARDYAWKSVSSEEFQKVAEAASKQQLTYFFAQWVNSTGVPQFKRTWAVYRTQKGYQVVGKVTQDLDIFRMPVEIRVVPEGRKPVNDRVMMVGTTADFTINTQTKPLKVVVDPASKLLKYDDKTKVSVVMARGDQLVEEQSYLEAVKQYQQVLEINKNSSLAHYKIGETFFKLHNYNAAAEELRAALAGDLDPKWVEVWAHLTLGKIFDVTGQRDRALNEYQRALQTNDNTQGALAEANAYIQKAYSEQSHAIG